MAEFKEVMKQKERMCGIIGCENCPLGSLNNKHKLICTVFLSKYPEEAEEIILNWHKEHPLKTNLDKFIEVFGVKPSLGSCPFYCCGCEDDCNFDRCSGFWYQEYKED